MPLQHLRFVKSSLMAGVEHVTYRQPLSPELITVPKGVNLPPHAMKSLEQSTAKFSARSAPKAIKEKEVNLTVEVEAVKPANPVGKTAETD